MRNRAELEIMGEKWVRWAKYTIVRSEMVWISPEAQKDPHILVPTLSPLRRVIRVYHYEH